MTESSYNLQQIVWQEVYWPHPFVNGQRDLPVGGQVISPSADS